MEGFEHVKPSSVATSLGDIWVGKKIALSMLGGVGDVVIALGGTAKALMDQTCHVTCFANDYQLSLLAQMEGVSNVECIKRIHDPACLNTFDVYLSFYGTFNTDRQLRDSDYYTLVSNRAGLDVRPGKFNLPIAHEYIDGRPVCLLHPGSSNPNRRWASSKWEKLAYNLREYGYHVVWLGAADEYGFSDERIEKLSDKSLDLLGQTAWMARHGSLFIGNDSGYCHIAGVLGIKGLVLFSATRPEDVICRYLGLDGVDAFDLVGPPSRSLAYDDAQSNKAMKAITLSRVLAKLEISAIDCTHSLGKGVRQKRRVAVVTDLSRGEELSRDLSLVYDIDLLIAMPGPEESDKYDAVVVIRKMHVMYCDVQTRRGTVHVDSSHVENIVRAIRDNT